MSDLSKFTDEEGPSDDQLASLNSLVARAVDLQDHLAFLENAFEQAQKEYRQIVEKDLVERLAAAGTLNYTTTQGAKVEVTKGLMVSELKDPVKRMERAKAQAEWLESVGGESLIKEEVTVTFEKGDHAQCKRVLEMLEALRLPVPIVHGESVHPSSLKSFVTDYMANVEGKEPPLKELGLFLKTEAKIKMPKQPKGKKS